MVLESDLLPVDELSPPLGDWCGYLKAANGKVSLEETKKSLVLRPSRVTIGFKLT